MLDRRSAAGGRRSTLVAPTVHTMGGLAQRAGGSVEACGEERSRKEELTQPLRVRSTTAEGGVDVEVADLFNGGCREIGGIAWVIAWSS